MSDKLRDAIELRKVTRFFYQGDRKLEVLRNASLCVVTGEAVGLRGPSGSGKSTLLHVAGLLEKPDDGEVLIDGRESSNLADDARTQLRRHQLGFVYQFHHLLPEFSAQENVALPLMIGGLSRAKAEIVAAEMLVEVGLTHRVSHYPSALSGGERRAVSANKIPCQLSAVILYSAATERIRE